MLVARRVEVGDTPTLLVTAPAHAWAKVTVRVPSGVTDDIDIGPADVVKGQGFRMPSNQRETIELPPGESLYAVAPSLTTIGVHVLAVSSGGLT
jgi:hypothetical protein